MLNKMSLNNIIATTDPTITTPNRYGDLSVKLQNLIVDGDIIVENNDFNREGYTLQCYSAGRARFLPQPVLNKLEQDNFEIYGEPSEANQLLAFLRFRIIENEANFIVRDGGENLECVDSGLYLVIYKITKLNSTFGLQISLSIDEVDIPYFYSETPYLSSPRPYASNYCAALARINDGQIISLSRISYPADSTFQLANQENIISTIAFIKINS